MGQIVKGFACHSNGFRMYLVSKENYCKLLDMGMHNEHGA